MNKISKNQEKLLSETTDYHEWLIKRLSNKKEAAAYLKIALEEYELHGDVEFFMTALKNVAEAQGGLGLLAQKTQLDRSHLYRILSSKGNPRFLTLDSILRAMGFRLSITAISAA